jgi:hypothetical protein
MTEPLSPECEYGGGCAAIDAAINSTARADYAMWCRACLIAALDATPAPPDGLREAAQAVVDLTDDLARWDEINRYVVNSQRDYLAGNLDAAWDRLRAVLARLTPEDPA